MILFLLVSSFSVRFFLVSFGLTTLLSQFMQEREKRARKKTGAGAAAADSEEPTETVQEDAEPEEEEQVEIPVAQKTKERKEHTVRQRGGRPRGTDSLPKAILKRKKATNYWMWAIPAALVVIVLMVVGYSYLS